VEPLQPRELPLVRAEGDEMENPHVVSQRPNLTSDHANVGTAGRVPDRLATRKVQREIKSRGRVSHVPKKKFWGGR